MHALRDRFEARLRGARSSPFRDIVEKRPSEGQNVAPLDGIRGVALLIVVASHTHALGLQKHGAVGVWLFFCLSAFLLTSSLAARPERTRRVADLLHYSRRRIGRIVPMYYVVLMVSFLYGGWSADRLLPHLLFLRGDNVYWSIPQELLFYLVLPVLVLLLTWLLRRSDLAIATSLCGLAVVANLWLDVSVLRLEGNDTWLPFYLGVFASGMSAAYLYRWETLSRVVATPRVNRVLHWLGMAILLALFLTAPHYQRLVAEVFPALPGTTRPLAWTNPGVFGLLCSTLIWITLVCEGRLLHRLMSSLPLRAIGLVSFSMYLLHMPVKARLLELGIPLGIQSFVCTTLVTYVFSAVTYALIERPFMRGPPGRAR